MFGSFLEMEDEGEYASDNSGQNFVANFKVSVACVAGARKGKGKGKVRARGSTPLVSRARFPSSAYHAG